MADIIQVFGVEMDTSRFQAGVRRVEQSQRRLTAGAGRLRAGFSAVTRSLRAVGIAAAATAAAYEGLRRLTVQGGEAIGVQNSFGRAVANSGAAIEMFRKSTRGLIADQELMTQFNRAITLGAASNERDFSRLSRTAVELGRALGVDAKLALESLSLGIGRQSRLLLDNLGIIVKVEDANNRYAKKLGIASSALTDAQKRIAFTEAAYEAADTAIEKLGESTLGAADAAAAAGAAWLNFTTAIKTFLAQSPLLEGFFSKMASFFQQETSVEMFSRRIAEINEALSGGEVQREDRGMGRAALLARRAEFEAQRAAVLANRARTAAAKEALEAELARTKAIEAQNELLQTQARQMRELRTLPRGVNVLGNNAQPITGQQILEGGAFGLFGQHARRSIIETPVREGLGVVDPEATIMPLMDDLLEIMDVDLPKATKSSTEGFEQMAAVGISSMAQMVTQAATGFPQIAQGFLNMIASMASAIPGLGPLGGALIGGIAGIVGGLFGGRKKREPTPVSIVDVAPDAQDKIAPRVTTAVRVVSSTTGELLDQFLVEAARLDRRDGTRRIAIPGVIQAVGRNN